MSNLLAGCFLMFLVLQVVYGWMIYTLLYYRDCRRKDLIHLLTSSVESGVPLAPALRAYLHDRPRGAMRSFWLGTLLAVFPVPGFYWIRYRHRNFDRYVEDLTSMLENGTGLHQALQRVPALASRETVLAAAVGESTGQLERCLRAASQQRVDSFWFDLLPQVLYPVFMLAIISSFVCAHVYWVVPRMSQVYRDFTDMPLPAITQSLIRHTQDMTEFGPIWLSAIQLILITLAVLVINPTTRWFLPGVGTVYRRLVQSRVLRFLGMLLETGKSLPESLGVLANLPIGGPAPRRLCRARAHIEQGEPFAESLLRVGLLSESLLPLVHAAKRNGNLPWALMEMAESIQLRTIRLVRRIVQTLFPAAVVLLGIVVGFVVVAVYVPLVSLISEMAL